MTDTYDESLKEGSKRYRALLKEALELHISKNKGYSANDPDAFANFRLAEGMGLTPVQGVLVRLGDKFARVQSLAKNPENDMVGESMRDTLMDLSAYVLIAICLIEEAREAEDSRPRTEEELRAGATIPQSAADAALENLRYTSLSMSGITCYNRDADGFCLGHPVKDGPIYHGREVREEDDPIIHNNEWYGRGRDADGTL